jgi:HAD superfamily hydrolase (TIGR01662 family)
MRLARGFRPEITIQDVKNAITQAWDRAESDPLEAAMRSLLGLRAEHSVELISRVKYRSDLEQPYRGAARILQQLEKTYRLGVIANQQPGLKQRLNRLGLGSHISICVGSGDIGIWKPNPEIFRWALQRADCAPERAIMIGDRPDKDIEPARRLGLKTIRVLQGPARAQAATGWRQAEATVSCLTEIPEAVANLSRLSDRHQFY